jgi:small subunit ribosomal protein S16
MISKVSVCTEISPLAYLGLARSHTIAYTRGPMLVIRLQRTGRKNLASYRLVVAEKARAVKGKFHEVLGYYLPMQNPKVFKIDQEKVSAWISKGAIPSDTVARLLKRDGMKNMDKYIQRYTKQSSKDPEVIAAAEAAAAAAAAPAAAPVAAEAPAAEAAAEAPAETPAA